MGRLVSRVLHLQPGPSDLAQAIAKAEAWAAELTDADINAELDAYNVERHSAPAA